MNVNTKKSSKPRKESNNSADTLKSFLDGILKFPNRLDDFWSKSFNKFSSADIWEDEDNIYIKTATPGMSEEDLEINIEDNMVQISGKTSKEEEKNEKRKYFLQKLETNFDQKFDLPENVDTEKAFANYKDGIITITLPKFEKTKSKKIPLTS